MGIFDNIGDAKVTGAGNWVRDGIYEARILSVKLTENFKGEQLFAIDMVVTNAISNNDGKGHQVGEEFVHMLKVSQPSFLGNVKQFISSSYGVTPDEVTKANADKVTSAEQPMAGMIVGFNAKTVPTQKGGLFTAVTYTGEVVSEEATD